MTASLPFNTGPALGEAATLGLIVLQTDETIEAEFRPLFARPGIALHTSRVPSGKEVTPDTLAAMEAELPRAAALLPHAARFDAIAYACTSGATVIGPDRVAELVSAAARTAHVTNPLTAVLAALDHLGIRRLAYISPYIDSVTAPMRAAIAAHGVTIPHHASFEEPDDATVARIAPQSTLEAAREIGTSADVDAVFLSCTNLQTFSVIDEIEAALGKPVLSSNQALAWHLQRLAGIQAQGPGCLFGG